MMGAKLDGAQDAPGHSTMSTLAESFAIDREGLRAFLIQARLSERLVEKTFAQLEEVESVERPPDPC